jgi:hypothetical protein
MAYPALRPTSRDFDPGSYPVKSFRAQSGAEVRILYGSRRTDQALTLGYDNIPDSDAQQFVTHFDEVFGTFSTFALPDSVRSGWSAAANTLDAVTGAAWRYDAAPTITSVRPGRSSVRVSLKAVI